MAELFSCKKDNFERCQELSDFLQGMKEDKIVSCDVKAYATKQLKKLLSLITLFQLSAARNTIAIMKYLETLSKG